MKRLSVVIAGGGIGGLSAALSLASQGIESHVLEQASAFGEVGAGIQLSPNATRVLFLLGLESQLRGIGFAPVAGETRHWKSGRVLGGFPLGRSIEEAFGFPYLQVHRADLIDLLASSAGTNDLVSIHTGAEVVAFDQGEDEVRVAYEQDGRRHTLAADVLIGADGVHSTVRDGLFGAESPRFTGNIAWRALVPVSCVPEGLVQPKATVWWGPGRHFVHYYVRRGELVNCVFVVEKAGWEVESWSERGEYEELKTDFAGWHRDVHTLIDAADRRSLHKWALFDRPPMREWGRGRVTLLGDACHPTLPFMAQGAAMAIEDGAVLARCLEDTHTVSAIRAALERYREQRIARVTGVQRGSARNGRIYHLRGLPALMRNLTLRFSGGRNPWSRIYSYNAVRNLDGRNQ